MAMQLKMPWHDVAVRCFDGDIYFSRALICGEYAYAGKIAGRIQILPGGKVTEGFGMYVKEWFPLGKRTQEFFDRKE